METKYKGFSISRRYPDGWQDSLVASKNGGEHATFASSFEGLLIWIDLLMDGKETEGYFQKY